MCNLGSLNIISSTLSLTTVWCSDIQCESDGIHSLQSEHESEHWKCYSFGVTLQTAGTYASLFTIAFLSWGSNTHTYTFKADAH